MTEIADAALVAQSVSRAVNWLVRTPDGPSRVRAVPIAISMRLARRRKLWI